MGPDSEGPRAYVITDDSRSGMLVIASTTLFSWMVLFFFIRAYTRIVINGPFGLDDVVAGIGTVRDSAVQSILRLNPIQICRQIKTDYVVGPNWTRRSLE